MASCFVRKAGIVCVRCFRRARVLGIVNALAAWMFHGRAYAGGRFVFLYRIVHLGTP